MKKLIALLLAMAMLLSLAACGEKEEKDISGYYVLKTAIEGETELDGETLAFRDYELFVLLNKDKTAVVFNGEEVLDCTYGKGKITPVDGEAMTYEVKDTTLTLKAADIELVFELSNDTAPDLDELRTALSIPAEVGYYIAESFIYDDETYTAEELGLENFFLIMNEDGTAAICNGTEIVDLTWADGILTPTEEDDEPVQYVLDGDTITLTDEEDSVIVFKRSDEEAPDLEQLREELTPKIPGYYVMTQLTSGDTVVGADSLAAVYDPMPFLLLNEDGTGYLYLQAVVELEWDEKFLIISGDGQEYTLVGDTLTIEEDSTSMTFERSEDTPPDIDSLLAGIDSDKEIYGEYTLYSYDMGSGEMFDASADLVLYTDGTGLYSYTGNSMDVTWTDASMTIGTIVYSYEYDENGYLRLDGSDGKFVFAPNGSEEMSIWTNDWYGFWMMTDCTGTMEEFDDMWWDMCASSYVENGEGYMIFWDEDINSMEDPLGEMYFSVLSDLKIISTEGWLYYDDFTDELSCDLSYSPVDDMLILEGTYEDSECSYTYTIYLRPWGVKWDDLDESYLPYYYEDWYLPLINAGEAMPVVFEIPE